MLDMSWGEVLVIGAIALIVIGPKDLPRALRTVGNVVGKARRMAGEFQSQFNEAMREAELDEVRRQFDTLNKSVAVDQHFDPVGTVRDELKGAIEAPPAAPRTESVAADRPEPPTPAGEPTGAIPAPSAPPPPEPEPALVAAAPASAPAAAKPAERPE